MDLTEYRESAREQGRIDSLMSLVPPGRLSALDIGARDGYLSHRLAQQFESVTALDLEKPNIDNPRVIAVKGDATRLEFADNSFDTVLCAEVLEHIPPHLLGKACDEIARVARHDVVIGVPYRQDTRFGQTTCQSCGKPNPPWGHVNTFDEARLDRLFRALERTGTAFVGESLARTNFISATFMDMAGNPYGTYDQEEPCVHCGASLQRPPERTFLQKVGTRMAIWVRNAQLALASPRPNWIHVRYSKRGASGA